MESNSNVLIIDDHILFREWFEALLKGVEMIKQIYLTGTETEAFDILAKNSIQLIFMDIKLEESSGIDLTYKIRRVNKNIKIIGLSMYSDKSNIARMINAGANGYLPKNTSFKEVNEAICTVLNGERFFSDSLMNALDNINITGKEVNHKSRIFTELSRRELEVLKLICLGLTSAEIRSRLNISLKTVESHRYNILSKLDAKNMADAILYAVNNGILNDTINYINH